MPRVSVLMSVYNGGTYLREAIDSILQQKFTNFEFIIINDGSTDHSAEIMQSYYDPRIRYLENDKNIGLISSLNRGLALAESPYIARMDADDISLPGRLAKQVNFLNEHSEVGALGGSVQIIDGCGSLSDIWRFPTEHSFLKWCLFFDDPIAHPTVMMRRAAVIRAGGYSTDWVHAEDYDLWRRLSRITRLSNLQDVLLYLRRHQVCVTRVHHAQQLKNSIRISQLMMSEVLDEDVPIQIVQRLCSEGFEKLNDIRQAASVIYKLCQASVAENELPPTEKRMICRDAARRLLGLARQRTRDGRAWKILSLACRLDPLVIGRVAEGRFRRIVRERLIS